MRVKNEFLFFNTSKLIKEIKPISPQAVGRKEKNSVDTIWNAPNIFERTRIFSLF